MPATHSTIRTSEYTQGNNISAIGRKEPVAHPLNCKHECPYGHDKAYCFPCYKKIMEEFRAAKGVKKA